MTERNAGNRLTLQSLGRPLAQGRTAEIFAWGDQQVLKLYRAEFAARDVDLEANKARQVYATGLRVPAVGEVIEIENRRGLIYERLDGPTLLDQLGARPWQLLYIAHTMAQLHVDLHTRVASTLPSTHQRLARKIEQVERLPDSQRRAILQVLATLKDSDSLCHNDFHPANILLTTQGPIVIDWLDATQGNPLADVARTSLLIRFAGLPPPAMQRAGQAILRALLHTVYLRRYFQLRPGGQRELQRWLIPVTAARLLEDQPGEQAPLLAYLEKLLRADRQ
ncbi:MAG: phosphotransferase [Chloroflexota bacterium]|nr:phosphotransferase [Chloroflexota bacterium]